MRLLTVTDSDIIEAVGYDQSIEALGVVFKSSPDTMYSYGGVKPETFGRLVSADSIGKAFHELFRKTKHPFTKSTREPEIKK